MPSSRRGFFKGVAGLAAGVAGGWAASKLPAEKPSPEPPSPVTSSGYAIQQQILYGNLPFKDVAIDATYAYPWSIPWIGAGVYYLDYHDKLLERLNKASETFPWTFVDGEWKRASKE